MTPSKKAKPAAAEVKQPTQTAPAPAPTTPAPTPQAKPEVVGKQQQTLTKLKDAWATRGIDVQAIEVTADGKFLNVKVGADWPLIVLGASGGIDLPEIKSYPKAFDAAVEGDKLLAKQRERTAKKTAAPAPATTKQPEAPKEVRQQA